MIQVVPESRARLGVSKASRRQDSRTHVGALAANGSIGKSFQPPVRAGIQGPGPATCCLNEQELLGCWLPRSQPEPNKSLMHFAGEFFA